MPKICKKCGLEKELSEFHKKKVSKDEYRNQCKLCCSKNSIIFYNKNKNIIKIKNKEWRESNLEKLKINQKTFLIKNPNYQKEWYQKNKENINIRNKKRRHIDIKYRLKENIRNLIKNSIKFNNFKKDSKTIEILGCNGDDFKLYLESKFETWMNWNNYGNPKDGIFESNKTWDIDHILPIASAKSEEDIIRLNHYTNLQPLCSYKNRVTKRVKIL